MPDHPDIVQEPSEEPREGTLAWLQQQPHLDVQGLSVPNVHRIVDGSTLAPLDDNPGTCRVIRPNEAGRCRAPATRRYGICIGHAGGGMRDYAGAAQKAHAAKARLRVRRQLLGIGPARVGNPRQHARLQALERAEALAEALVSAPLDDASLGTIERQIAVVRALDATFPLQQTSVELEVPADPGEVAGMGWQAMQQLAARLTST